MSVKVKSNMNKILGSAKQKYSLFLRLMEDEVLDISTPKTPRRTGRLREGVLKQVLGLRGKISWQKSYAAIQETKQFKNYTTAGTGPHFARNAIIQAAQKTNDIVRKVGAL